MVILVFFSLGRLHLFSCIAVRHLFHLLTSFLPLYPFRFSITIEGGDLYAVVFMNDLMKTQVDSMFLLDEFHYR